MQKTIIKDKIKLPAFLSSEAHSLLKGLLQKESSKRLGSGPSGSDEIKHHKWFKSINWIKLDARQIHPSFVPDVAGMHCTSNFEERWTNMSLIDSPASSPRANEEPPGNSIVSEVQCSMITKPSHLHVESGSPIQLDTVNKSNHAKPTHDVTSTIPDTNLLTMSSPFPVNPEPSLLEDCSTGSYLLTEDVPDEGTILMQNLDVAFLLRRESWEMGKNPIASKGSPLHGPRIKLIEKSQSFYAETKEHVFESKTAEEHAKLLRTYKLPMSRIIPFPKRTDPASAPMAVASKRSKLRRSLLGIKPPD